MKKLFTYLMVAAVAFAAACTSPEEPKKPVTQEFYGFEADGADVAVIGNDEYIIQMFVLDEEYYATRLMSAHIKVEGVVDEVLPEGNYPLIQGEIGNSSMYIKGSYYQNSVAEVPYMLAMTDGELEVKHTANGISLTIYSANGTNVTSAEGGTMNVACRYIGTELEFYTPVIDNILDYTMAIYKGPATEDGELHMWTLQMLTQRAELLNLVVLIDKDDVDPEAGIPSGTYPIDAYLEGASVLAYYDGYGSMVYTLDSETMAVTGAKHGMMGGEMKVVNNGENIDIDILFYNQFYIPYTASYSGPITYADGTQIEMDAIEYAAIERYSADGGWFVYIGDGYNDVMLVLDCIAPAGTFEDGLPAGKYTIPASGELAEFSLRPGAMHEQYGPLPSTAYGADMKSYYDLIGGGEMEVTKNADGSYKFAFNVTGADGVYRFYGEYTGAVAAEDSVVPEGGETTEPEGGETTEPEGGETTEPEVPAAVRAKAPLKDAAKQSVKSLVKIDKDAAFTVTNLMVR